MALQQLNEVIPDVIFMDVNMPGIDGLEVLRFLRRDPMTKDVPVIIVSAEGQEESKRAAIDAGANYYIVKPPTLEEIEKALDLVVHLANDSEEPDDQKGRAPDTRAAD
jgi:CheY-like chemotaxis protein